MRLKKKKKFNFFKICIIISLRKQIIFGNRKIKLISFEYRLKAPPFFVAPANIFIFYIIYIRVYRYIGLYLNKTSRFECVRARSLLSSLESITFRNESGFISQLTIEWFPYNFQPPYHQHHIDNIAQTHNAHTPRLLWGAQIKINWNIVNCAFYIWRVCGVIFKLTQIVFPIRIQLNFFLVYTYEYITYNTYIFLFNRSQRALKNI